MGTCHVCGKHDIEYYKGNKSLCKQCKRDKSKKAYIPKSRLYSAEYYTQNKNKRKEIQQRYNRTIKGRISAIKRIRRRKQYVMQLSAIEWIQILERYNYACLCCGTQENITIDHITPLSLGGTDTIDNIQPLCKSCNSKKGISTTDYRI